MQEAINMSKLQIAARNLSSENWEAVKGALEIEIGQRILSYDPETNSGVLGCATQIDNGVWQ